MAALAAQQRQHRAQPGRGIPALEHPLPVGRVEHHPLGDPVGDGGQRRLDRLELRSHAGEVVEVRAQHPLGEGRDLRVVAVRRLGQPGDQAGGERGAGGVVEAVEPEPAHPGGDEVHHRADRAVGQRHRVDPRLAADAVQVLHRVGADLVALADEQHPEPAVVLVELGEGAREHQVAGLEQLQREPGSGQERGAQREERQRRHTSL